MKAISALEEMKRVGLIRSNMTLRELRIYRRIFHKSTDSWLDVVKGIGLARYFSDDWPLPEEGIKIFGMQFGGTLRLELRLKEREKEVK